jgi:hypothetical protein
MCFGGARSAYRGTAYDQSPRANVSSPGPNLAGGVARTGQTLPPSCGVRKVSKHLRGDLVGVWPWPGTPPTVSFPERPRDLARWDPEPTSFQRWIVRHRTEVQGGAVLLLVLAVSWKVYLLVTVGFGVAVGAAIGAIALSIHVLLTNRQVSRYVEKYDSAPHQRPKLG